MSNLLLALEDWAQAIELGCSVDLIYMDFTKAFYSVSHKRLLVKLESAGIKGEVLQWIITLLTNRKHRVSGNLSNWTYAKSGVPQGSVLGSILFVIFINDMPNLVWNSCKLFADDAKIDTSSLQGDINSQTQWSHIWNLPSNEEKCKSMKIGKENTAQTYQMNEHELEQVEEEKDLAVITDKKPSNFIHTLRL